MEAPAQSSHKPFGSSDFAHRAFDAGLTHERKRLGATHTLQINGRSTRSAAATIQDLSPSDQRTLIGRFQQARPDHVKKAVKAAQGAFPFWRELGWEQRVSFLRKVAEVMEKHAHDFGALLCLETGKPRHQAMTEVQDSIHLIHLQCQQMEACQGFRGTLAATGSMRAYNTMEARGVWGILASSQAPLLTATGMIAAATLTGNTVVFKPASDAAFIGLRLYDLFPAAGFPVGIVNYITGPGDTTGSLLAGHADLDGLAFAGSRTAGVSVLDQFGRDTQRPCLLHMSANNPVIIMPTSPLEDTASHVLKHTCQSAGQGTESWSRVYVHRSIAQDFIEALVEEACAFRVGNPELPETQMGPLRNAHAVETFRHTVKQAIKDGRVVCGGNDLQTGDLRHGHFVEPTVVIELDRASPLQREPYPVPILTVTEIKSLEDGIRLANQSPYGVAAGIYSQVTGEQQQFYDAIQAGTLYCNHHPGESGGMPASGGWKASSSSGKSMSGPYFLPQFMKEQTRHIRW